MAVVKRKASHRSAVSPIVRPFIEKLPPGDLPILKNVLAKEHVAREADRYSLSDCATATICTALLCDIGLVTNTDQTMIIDKNKVRRECNVFRNKLVDDSQPNNTMNQLLLSILMIGKIKLLFILKTQKGSNT